MIGFDSNVILRALLADDPVQSALARRKLSDLSAEERGFISIGVIFELYWVFNRLYRMPRTVIVRTFRSLMEVAWLTFEDIEALARALHVYETKAVDFSDALIAEQNFSRGCRATVTFDKAAAKSVPGMELLS